MNPADLDTPMLDAITHSRVCILAALLECEVLGLVAQSHIECKQLQHTRVNCRQIIIIAWDWQSVCTITFHILE